MIRGDLIETTRESVAAAAHLAGHLGRLEVRLSPLLPVQSIALENMGDEDRERFHAFLRMFEQLHELTGRKLFRAIVMLTDIASITLSTKNLYRRMEALGVIDSAEAWMDVMGLRNELAHDYPTDTIFQAELINKTHSMLANLLLAVGQTLAYIEREHLLAE